MPVLTCSSWPQDGYRSSWHHVLVGNSKGGKGAYKTFPVSRNPYPRPPLKTCWPELGNVPRSRKTPTKDVAKNGSAKS